MVVILTTCYKELQKFPNLQLGDNQNIEQCIDKIASINHPSDEFLPFRCKTLISNINLDKSISLQPFVHYLCSDKVFLWLDPKI